MHPVTYFISAALDSRTNNKVCHMSVTLWKVCMNHTLCLRACPFTCCYCTTASKSRQVPSLYCCAWWHDVKHCVENCLHCGWGGMYCHDACLYKRLKMGFRVVDSVGDGLYSDVCRVWEKLIWQISERCSWKRLAWNFIRLLLQSWGFQQDCCGINPSSHLPGKHSQGGF